MRTGDTTGVIYVVVIFCAPLVVSLSIATTVDGCHLLLINAPMLNWVTHGSNLE